MQFIPIYSFLKEDTGRDCTTKDSVPWPSQLIHRLTKRKWKEDPKENFQKSGSNNQLWRLVTTQQWSHWNQDWTWQPGPQVLIVSQRVKRERRSWVLRSFSKEAILDAWIPPSCLQKIISRIQMGCTRFVYCTMLSGGCGNDTLCAIDLQCVVCCTDNWSVFFFFCCREWLAISFSTKVPNKSWKCKHLTGPFFFSMQKKTLHTAKQLYNTGHLKKRVIQWSETNTDVVK